MDSVKSDKQEGAKVDISYRASSKQDLLLEGFYAIRLSRLRSNGLIAALTWVM